MKIENIAQSRELESRDPDYRRECEASRFALLKMMRPLKAIHDR